MPVEFFDVLAWIFGTATTACFVVRFMMRVLIAFKLHDMHIAYKVEQFPILTPLIVATVCWSWLATR